MTGKDSSNDGTRSILFYTVSSISNELSVFGRTKRKKRPYQLLTVLSFEIYYSVVMTNPLQVEKDWVTHCKRTVNFYSKGHEGIEEVDTQSGGTDRSSTDDYPGTRRRGTWRNDGVQFVCKNVWYSGQPVREVIVPRETLGNRQTWSATENGVEGDIPLVRPVSCIRTESMDRLENWEVWSYWSWNSVRRKSFDQSLVTVTGIVGFICKVKTART